MSTPNAPLTIRDMIEPAIMAAGGWVNTHAHADRAYTLSPDVLEMRRTCTLQQKWDALDALKRNSTEEDFYRRFSMFFENQIAQGVSALATFVDIDPQSEDRAIKAGLRAREHYQDQLTVKFANQTLKGVIHPEARKWFDIGAELVDIIGALPKRDERDYGRGDEALCKEKSGYRITANLLIGITSVNKPVSTQALDKYTMNSNFFQPLHVGHSRFLMPEHAPFSPFPYCTGTCPVL